MKHVLENPIWITGAGGLIGNYLAQSSAARPALRLTRGQLDITDYSAVRDFFRRNNPRLIIHCAAISQTAACRKNPALARKVNVEATRILAELAADIPFIFFSTDLVFDGLLGNYAESSAVNPLSVYAETKAEAEKVVLQNPHHTVIRTSLNGGASSSGDRGFNEDLCRAWREDRAVQLFTDEFRCPIPAAVTARAVWELADHKAAGLYHLAGAERLSRWEIGQIIAARWPQLDPRIEPSSLSECSGEPRPPDCSLNCSKIQKLLSFPLPRLSQWLAANPSQIF